MTLQEILDKIENLPTEEQDYLLEILKRRTEEKEKSRGDKFWEGLQNFRRAIEEEGIIFTEDDFANLRDKSPGRDVNL
jgi:hypothetical protein